MAKAWAKFPYSDKKYQYTATTLKKAWDRLHKGDAEALPEERHGGRMHGSPFTPANSRKPPSWG